jgi:hypothetical protein
MAKLAVPFLTEVAHRVDPEKPASAFGAFILKVGVPLCKWNYKRFIRKQANQLIDILMEVEN